MFLHRLQQGAIMGHAVHHCSFQELTGRRTGQELVFSEEPIVDAINLARARSACGGGDGHPHFGVVGAQLGFHGALTYCGGASQDD